MLRLHSARFACLCSMQNILQSKESRNLEPPVGINRDFSRASLFWTVPDSCRTIAFRIGNDSGDKQIRSRVCPRVQQARALGRQLLERTAVHIKAYVVTIPETNLPDVIIISRTASSATKS